MRTPCELEKTGIKLHELPLTCFDCLRENNPEGYAEINKAQERAETRIAKAKKKQAEREEQQRRGERG